MTKTFRWYDYVTINIYYLGLSLLAQTMTPLVIPLLIQQFVGQAQQASWYGTIRLWGLMAALLAQAFWGMLSDRSTLRWGRRRPFILGGTLADLVFVAAIGLTAGMEGATGLAFLFAAYIGLQISSNAAQSAQQGLIPDLVPENLRGRFSAIKALFEVPLPVIVVAFTVGKLIAANNLWGAILTMSAILVASMVLALKTHEEPLKENLSRLDWSPFVRLVGMTALFTIIILGLGEAIKLVTASLASVNNVMIQVIALGLAGLLAMSIAVALGVWASVRISIGNAAHSNQSFTWWIVNRLAFLVGGFNLSSFAIYFMQARLGFAREQAAGPASSMLLIVGICVLIFAIISGWLSDHWGHKRVVALAGLVAALGTAVTIILPDLTAIYIGSSLIGAAAGLFYTANWALGTCLVPKSQAGHYLGISNLAGAGAGAIGAYIGGPIADFFTAHVPQLPGLGYVLLFGIYGTLFLLSTIALVGVRIPERK